MNILFLHPNFPAQFVHLAGHLARERGHEVVAIGGPSAKEIAGLSLKRYQLARGSTPGILPSATRYEADCLRGEAAAGVAAEFARDGFRPDVMVGHAGWGELLFLKEVWPEAKAVAYAEYYYRGRGGDGSFDLELDEPTLANRIRAHAKTAGLAICVAEADLAIAPTEWQRSCYPEPLRSCIVVAHDGIDTVSIRPRPDGTVQLSEGGKGSSG